MSILRRLRDIIPNDSLTDEILSTAALLVLSSDLIEELDEDDEGFYVKSLRSTSLGLTRSMEELGVVDGRSPSSEMVDFMNSIRKRFTGLMNESEVSLGFESWYQARSCLKEIDKISAETVDELTLHCMGVLRTSCGMFLEVSEVE